MNLTIRCIAKDANGTGTLEICSSLNTPITIRSTVRNVNG